MLVNVQIFGDLVWPVRFPGVVLEGERTLYELDVEHDAEAWASTLP